MDNKGVVILHTLSGTQYACTRDPITDVLYVKLGPNLHCTVADFVTDLRSRVRNPYAHREHRRPGLVGLAYAVADSIADRPKRGETYCGRTGMKLVRHNNTLMRKLKDGEQYAAFPMPKT